MHRKHARPRRRFNPARIVAGSFGLLILLGTLLLMLPAASRNGESAGLLTALFTATSASCVTGLVLVDTWLHWTLFGQMVILFLIQLGGLGFVTVLALLSLALHRRLTLSERLVMVSALNLNDLSGVVRVIKGALLGTLILEGAGAVVLSLCLIPRFGLLGGIWRGVFQSVSSFCNAGFDLMGVDGPFTSLTNSTGSPVLLLTVMVLVVTGGLGFFVWADLARVRRWKGLSLYSRMVLIAIGVLTLLGAAAVLAAEWSNPATLGPMPVWKKILNALFQSVTLRTAGYNTIDQGALTPLAAVISILLMLVGGGSGSTAGGVKVGTVCVLAMALRAGLRGEDEVVLQRRTVEPRRVFNAMTLIMLVLVLLLAGTLALSAVDRLPLLDAAFEAASALGTAGLTRGATAQLSNLSRLIVICLMFLGRVGILSCSLAFLTRTQNGPKIKYPAFDVMIG